MKFTISTPQSLQELTIAWLEINTPTGNYVIQKGHAPMIIGLSSQKPLTYRLISGKQDTIIVRRGIVSIDRVSATAVIVIDESEQS